MKKNILSVACSLILLTGCASDRLPEPEKVNIGNIDSLVSEIQQIDNSIKTKPGDIELRTERQSMVTQLVNYYLLAANQAVARNDYLSATKFWRSALSYQPGNFSAQQGLKKIEGSRALDKLYQQAVGQYKTDPELALQKIQQVLEEDPNWPQAAEMRDHLMREIAVQNQPETKMNR